MPMPIFTAGRRLRASELKALSDQVDSLTTPGWTDYSGTFVIGAAVTPPTKGNSTYSARWRRAANSDLVQIEINIVIGSTFVQGSGAYRFPVPVAADAATSAGAIGSLYVLDAGTANRTGVCLFGTANTFIDGILDNVANSIGSSNPQVWATGDIIKMAIEYKPA